MSADRRSGADGEAPAAPVASVGARPATDSAVRPAHDSAVHHEDFRRRLGQRLVLVVVVALLALAVALGVVAAGSQLRANRVVGGQLDAAIADQRLHLVESVARISARQSAAARSALQERCDALAGVLAGLVTVPLLTADQAGLDRPCGELLRDPDVAMAWIAAEPGGLRTTVVGAKAMALVRQAGPTADDAGVPPSPAAVARALLARPDLVMGRSPVLKDGGVEYVAVVVADDADLHATQAAIAGEVATLARETDGAWAGLRRSLASSLATASLAALATFALLAALGTLLTALAARRVIARLVAELDRLGERVRGLLGELSAANEGLERRVAERTRELEDAQLRLVDTARRAGQAEVATEVLHNVGNVLTSITVTTVLLGDRLRGSAGDRVAALARRAAEDPALAARLPEHLASLAPVLADERQAGLADIAALRQHLDHVAHIVRHQGPVDGAGAVEVAPVELAPLVAEAQRIAFAGLADPPAFIAEPVPGLVVRSDRHRLLQILVNLLLNACHACAAGGTGAPRITVGAAVVEGRLRLSVADNGVGIAAAHLPRLFDLGFTTRGGAAGGQGIGLHTSANAARLLGGALTAASPGPGQGAIFTLELPTV